LTGHFRLAALALTVASIVVGPRVADARHAAAPFQHRSTAALESAVAETTAAAATDHNPSEGVSTVPEVPAEYLNEAVSPPELPELTSAVLKEPVVQAAGGSPIKRLADRSASRTSLLAEHLTRDAMHYDSHKSYRVFSSPDIYTRVGEMRSGGYVVIGIEVDKRGDAIVSVAPLPGSPADRARDQPGDRNVKIDGKATDGWTNEEASKALRGKPGTSVSLEIERAGLSTPVEIKVTRQAIHQSAVRRTAMLSSVQATWSSALSSS